MALTFPRWLALVAIGFVLVFVTIFREPARQSENRSPRTVVRQRAARTGLHLGAAAGRLHVLQVRDSVRAAMGPAASRQSRAAIDRGLEPQMRRVIESLLASVNVKRPATAVVPVDIAFVSDTARSSHGVAYRYTGLMTTEYVLPRPHSDERCLVLVRVKNLAVFGAKHPYMYARVLTDPARMRLLGPCAFYERFGEPSPAIDRWLRQHNWGFGLLADWSAPLQVYKSREWVRSHLQGAWLFMDIGLRTATASRSFACLAGNGAVCERAMLGRAPIRNRVGESSLIWSDNVVSTEQSLGDPEQDVWWFTPPFELGPRQWTILAEMVRTLGPERFARFWRSDQEPRLAFQAAAGTDIGTWTRDWALRMYGPQERGPGVPSSSVFYGIVVALAAVGVTMALSNRRTVA